LLFPRLYSFAALSGAAAFLAAATDPQASGTFLRGDDHRVARIAFDLASRAAAHCPEPIPLTGLQFHHLAEYALADRPGVTDRRRLDLGPGLLSVIEESPAARAGLAAGDVVLSVNRLSLSPSSDLSDPAVSARNVRARTRELLEAQLRKGPAELRILRGSEEQVVRISTVQGCPARVRLARSDQPTAVVDRGEIVVTTALLDEVQSDDELAVIIGHELAHVVLKHAERLRAQGVPQGMLREFGKNAARVLATEEEADRLGIKLAWAAGYDVSTAIPFWRRFYAKYDGPRLFRTHPSLLARERLIRETLAELEAGAQRPELGKGPLGQR
jgi:hypothetical protein